MKKKQKTNNKKTKQQKKKNKTTTTIKKKKKTQVDFSSKADWTTKPTKMSMRKKDSSDNTEFRITSAIPFSSMAKTTGTGLTTQMAMI